MPRYQLENFLQIHI